jgi:mRNA-degrading endonuclease RelE of RelBE toxin-antitoxin system
MKSVTTKKFRQAYSKLPKSIQDLARKNYKIWLNDKNHPSLQFKQVHITELIYSARIGKSYRALGVIEEKIIIWFWIGSHSQYDKLLQQM